MTWDIDTIDWRPIKNDPPGPTADQIVAKVLGNAQGGSIVLMHLGGYETFEALPRIVAGLRGAGYDLVTLDEMLRGPLMVQRRLHMSRVESAGARRPSRVKVRPHGRPSPLPGSPLSMRGR